MKCADARRRGYRGWWEGFLEGGSSAEEHSREPDVEDADEWDEGELAAKRQARRVSSPHTGLTPRQGQMGVTSAMDAKEIVARYDDGRRDLSGARLGAADLPGADLRRAKLPSAGLCGAKLRRADLREADLTEANLSWASLYGADLTGADLTKASLCGADLKSANLESATWRGSW
jgi:hypothetical protein